MTGIRVLVDLRTGKDEWEPVWLVRRSGNTAWIVRTTRGPEEQVPVVSIRDHEEEP